MRTSVGEYSCNQANSAGSAPRYSSSTDPLAAITNTTRIAAVVANGRLLEQTELRGLLDAAEQAAATPAASPIP